MNRTNPANTSKAGAWSRLIILLLGETALFGLFLVLGSNPGRRVDFAHFTTWIQATPPTDAIVAAALTIGVIGAFWLFASTLLYTAARLMHLTRIENGMRIITLPAVRRVVDAALALSIAGTAMFGAGRMAMASPLQSQRAAVASAHVSSVTARGAFQYQVAADQGDDVDAEDPAADDIAAEIAALENAAAADTAADEDVAAPGASDDVSMPAVDPGSDDGAGSGEAISRPPAPNPAPVEDSTPAPTPAPDPTPGPGVDADGIPVPAGDQTSTATPTPAPAPAPAPVSQSEDSDIPTPAGDQQSAPTTTDRAGVPTTAVVRPGSPMSGGGSQNDAPTPAEDPTVPTTPATPSAPAIPEPTVSGTSVSAAQSYTVQSGDNFWTIAANQVQQKLGRTPTNEEVRAYWVVLIEANQANISSGNPNLIFPGETFTLPPV